MELTGMQDPPFALSGWPPPTPQGAHKVGHQLLKSLFAGNQARAARAARLDKVDNALDKVFFFPLFCRLIHSLKGLASGLRLTVALGLPQAHLILESA
jgi:hypothetical protein